MSKTSRTLVPCGLFLWVLLQWSPAFVSGPGADPLVALSAQRHSLVLSRLCRAQAPRAEDRQLAVGDAVRVLHEEHQEWYEGVIQGVKPDGMYYVRMDIPDSNAEWRTVPEDCIEPMFVYKDYKPGSKVLFALEGVGATQATVKDVQPRGLYVVKYYVFQRPDRGRRETLVHAKDMRIRTSELFVGQRCPGKIEAFEDSVAIVEIGAEAYARLNASEVPEALREVGLDVEVRILRVHDDKVEVTLARPMKPPTVRRERKSSPRVDDASFTGIVVRSRRLGAMVELTMEDGSKKEGALPGVGLKVGQKVRVKIESVDDATGMLMLSEVQALPQSSGRERGPQVRTQMRFNAFADIPQHEWLDGQIRAVHDYGAFVRVHLNEEVFADGLIHKTGFQDGPVHNVTDQLAVGQAVRVRVKKLDLVNQQLEFTMYDYKPTTKTALSHFVSIPRERWLKGKVRKLTSFGIFVSVTADGVTADGLVNMGKAKRGYMARAEDEFYMGQEVEVRVDYVDLSERKMGLTMLDPEDEWESSPRYRAY